MIAEDSVYECARCGRNSVDNPEVKQWRIVPSDDRPSGRMAVCIACFDPTRP